MKILVADDDPTIRTILQSLLMRLHHKPVIAGHGDQAWASLQGAEPPELAILDWNMPGISGIEICRKLRQRKDAPYVYVILLTGNDRLNDLVEGMEAGADDYMTKPFKPAELNVRLYAGLRILDLQRDLLAAKAQLERLANRDALTGLWNRRVILDRLDEELVRAERERSGVGAILLDIDRFKLINDRLGHQQGDAVLQQVAQRLKESLRPYDSVGRYGGEEFLVVVANCTKAETLTIAERLRHAIASMPLQSAVGEIPVTASFGVGVSDFNERRDGKTLIGTADWALYRAKALGRNRVEAFSREIGRWGSNDAATGFLLAQGEAAAVNLGSEPEVRQGNDATSSFQRGGPTAIIGRWG